jgi:hypothetical protein
VLSGTLARADHHIVVAGKSGDLELEVAPFRTRTRGALARPGSPVSVAAAAFGLLDGVVDTFQTQALPRRAR